MAQKHRIFDPPQIRPHPKSLALGPLGDTTQGVETKLRPNWSRKGDIGLLVFYLLQAENRTETLLCGLKSGCDVWKLNERSQKPGRSGQACRTRPREEVRRAIPGLVGRQDPAQLSEKKGTLITRSWNWLFPTQGATSNLISTPRYGTYCISQR